MHAVSTTPAQPASQLASETSRAVGEVRGIHKSYDTVEALRDINLDFPRGAELWAVGACRIEVARLDPDPGGSDIELTWNGLAHAAVVDGAPQGASRVSALERVASERERGSYAAHAHRLDGDLWEILVLPL